MIRARTFSSRDSVDKAKWASLNWNALLLNPSGERRSATVEAPVIRGIMRAERTTPGRSKAAQESSSSLNTSSTKRGGSDTAAASALNVRLSNAFTHAVPTCGLQPKSSLLLLLLLLLLLEDEADEAGEASNSGRLCRAALAATRAASKEELSMAPPLA